tara:strand:+ start:312 stop:485 length:174 start_codon:yes stop_codon:yes gene_type:complete
MLTSRARCPVQVEKEKKFMVPKTKYTANPCSSIAMGNGLGSRGARARAQPRSSTPLR